MFPTPLLSGGREGRRDKETNAATARNLWVPAINNHGGFGRRAFVEIRDPWNVATRIREVLGTQTT